MRSFILIALITAIFGCASVPVAENSVVVEPKEAVEDKEIYKFTATAMESGKMEIEGPINDPFLMLQIFSGAMDIVIKHNIDRSGSIENK